MWLQWNKTRVEMLQKYLSSENVDFWESKVRLILNQIVVFRFYYCFLIVIYYNADQIY